VEIAGASSGTPKYATRDQRSARAASRVEYMNVNASSQIDAQPASAPNASVSREMRRRITLMPNMSISADVTAVGNAAGEKL